MKNNKINTDYLLKLKEQIEQSKAKVSQLKGKREQLMEDLRTRYECNSIEEAEEKIEEIAKVVEKLEQDKEKGIDELGEIIEL